MLHTVQGAVAQVARDALSEGTVAGMQPPRGEAKTWGLRRLFHRHRFARRTDDRARRLSESCGARLARRSFDAVESSRMSENFTQRLSDKIRRSIVERGLLTRTPVADPPLPSNEPLRSQAIAARSALRNAGIFVCFLGADAPARTRPPVDNGAA